jgi:hypothetical protein
MENVLGFSKMDIKLMLKQKKVEKKIFAEIDSAVEMYKKIGLFDELDDRYEDPNAVASATGAGGGDDAGGGDMGGGSGGGFGGFGGGMDLGGGVDLGGAGDEGGEELGAEPEDSEEPETNTQISESKLRKLSRISDKRMNSYMNDLLGEDEKPKSLIEEEIEDNDLLKSNKKMNYKTTVLLENMKKSLGKISVDEKNVLVENNQKAIDLTKEIFEGLDKITKS